MQTTTDQSKNGTRAGRSWKWYLRVPLKALIFLTVVFFALFPDPGLFVRQLDHIRNLERMVAPDAPELMVFEAVIRARLQYRADSRQAVAEGRTTPYSPCSVAAILNSFPEGIPPELFSSPMGPKRPIDSQPAPGTLEPPVIASQDGRPLIRFARDPSQFPAKEVQQEVASLVYSEVHYRWDWEVWGVADYMPTVGEMFAKSRENPDGEIHEDCDGRAVMAASLMRRIGFESRIVTDLKHVWVTTPQGEWMGPGGAKTMRSTPKGNVLVWSTAIFNAPIALTFGVAVFPLGRELIIALTVFLLLLHPKMNCKAAMLGGLFLLQGLLFMRFRQLQLAEGSYRESPWPCWIGLVHVVAAALILMRAAHVARRHSRRAQ